MKKNLDGNEKDVKFPESSLQKGQGYEVGETHIDANCFLLGTYAHFSPFQNIPNCVSLLFEKRFVPKVHVSEHLHFFPYKNAKKCFSYTPDRLSELLSRGKRSFGMQYPL